MKASDAFPSKYLKATDILNKRIQVIVLRVEMESIDPSEPDKPVCYFKNGSKPMVLNKTNTSVMVDLYGDEMDDWAGKPAILTTHRVTYQGKPTNGLLLESPPAGTKVPKAPPPPADDFGANDGSDVPF